MGGVGSGPRRKVYDPELVSSLCDLYRTGLTAREIALETALSYKVVWNVLSRNLKEGLRPAIPRNQVGENNAAWKGDDVTLIALHKRVEAVKGKPSKCEVCETTDDRRYEWANLTGHYEDVDDFARMCVSCHRKYDAKRRTETGQLTERRVS